MSRYPNSTINSEKSNNHNGRNGDGHTPKPKKPEQKITQEQYEKHISTIRNHAGSQFIQLRLDHLAYLKGDASAAVVLSYVLNLIRMKDSDARDQSLLLRNNLWIRCPLKDVMKHLSMKRDRAAAAIRTLRKERILRTRHRWGNVLWVRVRDKNLRIIEKTGGKREKQKAENPTSLENGNSAFSSSKNPTGRIESPSQATDGRSPDHSFREHSTTTNGTNRNAERNEPERTGMRNGTNRNEPERTGTNGKAKAGKGTFEPINRTAGYFLAVKLSDGLKKKRKVFGDTNLPAWAKRFDRFLKESQLPADEVEGTITAFLAMLGAYTFCPRTYCATTFCSRYGNVRDAIETWRNEQSGKPRKSGECLPHDEYRRRFRADELHYDRDHYSLERDEDGMRWNENYTASRR